MAERPSELDEKTLMNVEEKPVVVTEAASSEKETNTDETTGDPDQIRANIEETRAGMSETIDAIQEKLSFSNISEQVRTEVSDFVGETIQTAKDTVYDTVVEKVGFIMSYADKRISEISDTEIVKTARRNPLTLGLIGLGIGVLFFSLNKKNKKSKRSHYRYDSDYDERDYGHSVSSKNKKSSFSAAQSKVSDAASKVGDTVSSAAGAVSDTVSSAAGAVSDTVSDVANKTYQQVGNIGSKAQDFAGTAQDGYEYYMEENPLAVGAVALALGAAVGLAIPSTRIESQYMGEARDNLLQKAEQSARDAVEKVQQVAGQVKETVKEEAKTQGLT